jgi:phosphoribosylformylglycinamidine synthase
MAFAGQVGLEIDLDKLGFESSSILFSEELGAVVEVRKKDLEHVLAVFEENDLHANVHRIGHSTKNDEINFYFEGERILANTRTKYRDMWAQTTLRMQKLRDNPKCAEMEHKAKLDPKDPGLNVKLSFDINERVCENMKARPKIAILREQGVNGQLEMAAAFDRAGFSAVDVHMSDLLSKRVDLADFRGLVACGGFSYGDVLGAGEGWAKTILHTPHLSSMFKAFFERKDSFSLGVCNGCQMLSNLKTLIPGAMHWPKFVKNESDRFEARFSLVEIQESPSIFFDKPFQMSCKPEQVCAILMM